MVICFTNCCRQLLHLLLILIFTLLLISCSESKVTHQAGLTQVNSLNAKPYTKITVRSGDSLDKIAKRTGISIKNLIWINSLRRPYIIYPGQVLFLSHKHKSLFNKSIQQYQTKATKKIKLPAPKLKLRTWEWPLLGGILNKFKGPKSNQQGIDISGKPGDLIYSAANGKVVYSGKGLNGYGNLIIIKHDKNFISAYSNNEKIFVKENSNVKKGQAIASIGLNEHQQAALHFEVRHKGKPVNPLLYLPKK